MEKKVMIVFALIALLLLLIFGSFLFKDYFREDTCGNNVCDAEETELNCPADCKKAVNQTIPVRPVTPAGPTPEEKDLIDKTGLLLDDLRNLSKDNPDFFNDDDKDGLINGIEKKIGTDPKDSESNGLTDTDNDGATDLQEYISGTDSKDSNSK